MATGGISQQPPGRPGLGPRIWTRRRRAMGNLLPVLMWLIPTLVGIFYLASTAELLGPGLIFLAVGVGLGWLTTNYFGLFENAKIKEELEKICRPTGATFRFFVGFAGPSYSSALDPHEDVGFLEVFDQHLRFVSETRQIDLFRFQVASIRFRPNAHTWIGLGRWISIEGIVDGQPVRMLVEPREKPTLLGNMVFGGVLRRDLGNWLTRK